MASLIGKGFFRAIFLSSMLILLIFTGCGDDIKASNTTTVVHTVAAADNQTVSICFAQDLVSTATISPATSEIPMKFTVGTTPSVTVSGLPSVSGAIKTNSSGQVSLPFTALDASGSGTITVIWEFANTNDGTGSSTQTFSSAGC